MPTISEKTLPLVSLGRRLATKNAGLLFEMQDFATLVSDVLGNDLSIVRDEDITGSGVSASDFVQFVAAINAVLASSDVTGILPANNKMRIP